MKFVSLFVATLPAAILGWVLPVHAQMMEEGAWSALLLTPGGELAEATYEVKRAGGTTEATMKWLSGEVPVMDLHLEGNRLSFAWDPSFLMQCRLERAENRQFKGACRDERENLGPAVISPPGVAVTYADFDFDKAFALWGVSRDEYIKERYPQPSSLDAPDVPEPEPLPARSIEVDGRNLSLVEVGSGEVTVVLESGLGDDHQVWRSVQEALSDHARVVSYDRAGLGLSDETAAPRTPSVMAEELRDLLGAAGYEPPYVLVGHQTGAFTVRHYSATFPEEVAGVVLVDPSHEHEDDRYSALDADGWVSYLSRRSTFLSMVSEAAAREFDGYVEMLKNNEAPLLVATPDRAIIILSGQSPAEEPRWVGETDVGLLAKKELHRSLAEKMGADFVISTMSTAYLHMEDPDLVIDAVKEILASIEK